MKSDTCTVVAFPIFFGFGDSYSTCDSSCNFLISLTLVTVVQTVQNIVVFCYCYCAFKLESAIIIHVFTTLGLV